MIRRRTIATGLIATGLALTLAAGTAGLAQAQQPAKSADAYPNRQVRIIVPLAAGGLADILARIVAQKMQEESGQSVVVENRTGGAGAIGGEAAARATADGYTIFLGNQGVNATLPHLSKINFDPLKDFTAITQIAAFPNLLVVNPGLPAKSVKELVAYAKANPGKLSYASQQVGGSGHLTAEQFKLVAGIDMVHVPYKGAAPAVGDLVAGHVHVMFDSVTLQMPQIADGKTRPLAVMAPARVKALPDVPTMAEAGFDNIAGGTWFGLVAPTGTPREAIDYVYAVAKRAFADPKVRERYEAQGTALPLSSPEEFGAFIQADNKRWGEVIRSANIRID